MGVGLKAAAPAASTPSRVHGDVMKELKSASVSLKPAGEHQGYKPAPDPEFEKHMEGEALFRLADRNGDGVLSKEELQAFSRRPEGASMWCLFEGDRSTVWGKAGLALWEKAEEGKLTMEEFCAAYVCE